MNIFLVTIACHAVTVSRFIIVILKDIGYRIFLLQLYRLFSFLTITLQTNNNLFTSHLVTNGNKTFNFVRSTLSIILRITRK